MSPVRSVQEIEMRFKAALVIGPSGQQRYDEQYVEEREMKQFKGFMHRTNYIERTIELANQRDGVIHVPFEAIIHVERSID